MFGGFGVQVDVDECPDVSGMSNITAMPTFILYARGQEVARETGANPAKLRALLQKATYGTRTHTHTYTHICLSTRASPAKEWPSDVGCVFLESISGV